MKVAKRFRWEGAHRLPWHEGLCKNLHGHSYTLFLEVEGEPDANGLLVDFKHLKTYLIDLVDAWDHATVVAENDTELLEVVRSRGWKHFVLPYDSTAENMCLFAADHVIDRAGDALRARRVRTVTVRISETETCYAEAVKSL